MKSSLLFLFASLAISVTAFAAKPPTPPAEEPRPSYNDFLKQFLSPAGLTECVQQMDRVIDEGEVSAASPERSASWARTAAKCGLDFQFRVSELDEAVIYYVIISRGGQELNYSDAVKIAALFADRAGLTHPVNLTEGDKPVFYVQWLINPKEWKAMRKMMLKVREANRAEKDISKAFMLAIDREMSAREIALRGR